jgi:hypothetical protein
VLSRVTALQELVFSDEFSSYSSGTLGTPNDVRWTAMDFHYSSDKNEWQNYKPEQVTVDNGHLLLTLEDKGSMGKPAVLLLLQHS